MTASKQRAAASNPALRGLPVSAADSASLLRAKGSSIGGGKVIVRSLEGSIDALQEHLRALQPDLTVRPASSLRTMRFESRLLVTKDVRVWRNAYEASTRMSCEQPSADLLLFTPTRGGFHSLAHDDHQAKPGQMLCLYDSRPGAWMLPEGSVIEGVALPHQLITNRLKLRLGGRLDRKLEFKPVLETQTCAARTVRFAAQALITATEHHGLDLEGGAIQSLSTAMIDLVLEMLPNSYSDRLQRSAPQVSPRQVRRAMAYIHDNPMPVLTTDELADICEVSVRSLQYTFRDFVGVAPAEYWRKVRLERALEQLKKNPSQSVSSVAAEWGFLNVTRFRSLAGLV